VGGLFGAEWALEGATRYSYGGGTGTYAFASAATGYPVGYNLNGGYIGNGYASFLLGLVNNASIGPLGGAGLFLLLPRARGQGQQPGRLALPHLRMALPGDGQGGKAERSGVGGRGADLRSGGKMLSDHGRAGYAGVSRVDHHAGDCAAVSLSRGQMD
jgi:hypothetical protein